jgi:pimeloyl-ACP methyl ester carboxylesterase
MTTDTIALNVKDSGGHGRPVILIHGWPLSSDAWQDQMPALVAAGLRVIAYDRRGFGRSEKPDAGYNYDTLSDDLAGLIEHNDLRNVTLVGFSMGGGEVARYVARHGPDRLHSVVFASAVPPFLMKGDDNPDGPLTPEQAQEFERNLRADRQAFFDGFTTDFFSANGDLKVTPEQRQQALQLCLQSDEDAALGCMKAWATTDFRDDLTQVTVPTLVMHGDADGIVPIEGSGQRTHEMIGHSKLHVLTGAPHGCNVSHASEFNRVLIDFLLN